MNEVFAFLKECGAFFIITDNNGAPAGRPFNSMIADGNDLIIGVSNNKDIYRQLKANSLESHYLLKIPFADSYLTGKSLNNALNAGIKSALSASTNAVRNFINSKPKELVGGYCINPNDCILYTAVGQNEIVKSDRGKHKYEFYSECILKEILFGFSYNDSLKFLGVSIKTDKEVELSRATVYAAVKYKGEWLAARITK